MDFLKSIANQASQAAKEAADAAAEAAKQVQETVNEVVETVSDSLEQAEEATEPWANELQTQAQKANQNLSQTTAEDLLLELLKLQVQDSAENRSQVSEQLKVFVESGIKGLEENFKKGSTALINFTNEGIQAGQEAADQTGKVGETVLEAQAELNQDVRRMMESKASVQDMMLEILKLQTESTEEDEQQVSEQLAVFVESGMKGLQDAYDRGMGELRNLVNETTNAANEAGKQGQEALQRGSKSAQEGAETVLEAQAESNQDARRMMESKQKIMQAIAELMKQQSSSDEDS